MATESTPTEYFVCEDDDEEEEQRVSCCKCDTRTYCIILLVALVALYIAGVCGWGWLVYNVAH
jgi:hypothetical protein